MTAGRPQEYRAGARDTGERFARVRGYAIQSFRSYGPGGALLLVFVLVLLLGVALLGGAWSGRHAAPAAAEASPTPVTAAKVHVLNTLNGEPFLTAVNPIGQAIIGGEHCSLTVLGISYQAIVQSIFWPWDPPCDDPDAPAQICYNPLILCSEEFIFTGVDITVEIEWGPLLPDVADLPLVRFSFAHDGSAQPVTLLAWSFASGTVSCGGGGTEPISLSTLIMGWPPREICGAIGLQVEVIFKTEEFGDLEGVFTWLGEALTLEVDTGALLATPTASPTVSPSPTVAPADTPAPSATASGPAALPDTGGPPQSTSRPNSVALAIIGAFAVAAVVVATAAARRSP